MMQMARNISRLSVHGENSSVITCYAWYIVGFVFADYLLTTLPCLVICLSKFVPPTQAYLTDRMCLAVFSLEGVLLVL